MLAAKIMAQVNSCPHGTSSPNHTAALHMCRSVPSGRVGNAKDAIFRSNDHFRQAVAEREDCDVAELQHRLDRSLEKAERARIGVGQLRRFLEQLLQRRLVSQLCILGCWGAWGRPHLCIRHTQNSSSREKLSDTLAAGKHVGGPIPAYAGH